MASFETGRGEVVPRLSFVRFVRFFPSLPFCSSLLVSLSPCLPLAPGLCRSLSILPVSPSRLHGSVPFKAPAAGPGDRGAGRCRCLLACEEKHTGREAMRFVVGAERRVRRDSATTSQLLRLSFRRPASCPWRPRRCAAVDGLLQGWLRQQNGLLHLTSAGSFIQPQTRRAHGRERRRRDAAGRGKTRLARGALNSALVAVVLQYDGDQLGLLPGASLLPIRSQEAAGRPIPSW